MVPAKHKTMQFVVLSTLLCVACAGRLKIGFTDPPALFEEDVTAGDISRRLLAAPSPADAGDWAPAAAVFADPTLPSDESTAEPMMVAPSPAHIEADALAGSSVQAVALAGARVSGRLSIAQAPINLFDFKTNDFLGTLDARFANAAPNVPSNVEIKDGKVEFGYTSSNQILVDVETSGVVSLDFKSSAGWGNLRVTLSSDAFKGATAYRVIQDTSPGTADLKTSLSGDTLVIAIPEGRMRGTSVAGEFLYKIQLVAEGKPV